MIKSVIALAAMLLAIGGCALEPASLGSTSGWTLKWSTDFPTGVGSGNSVDVTIT